MKRVCCAILVILSGVMLGCGDSNPPVAKVTGTVTYKGEPVKSGTVTFMPKGGRPGYGTIVDGKITEVSTFGAKDGAPVGTCQVTVQSIEKGADMYAPTKSNLPDLYNDPAKSGLSTEIKPGVTNEVKFDLQ